MTGLLNPKSSKKKIGHFLFCAILVVYLGHGIRFIRYVAVLIFSSQKIGFLGEVLSSQMEENLRKKAVRTPLNVARILGPKKRGRPDRIGLIVAHCRIAKKRTPQQRFARAMRNAISRKASPPPRAPQQVNAQSPRGGRKFGKCPSAASPARSATPPPQQQPPRRKRFNLRGCVREAIDLMQERVQAKQVSDSRGAGAVRDAKKKYPFGN